MHACPTAISGIYTPIGGIPRRRPPFSATSLQAVAVAAMSSTRNVLPLQAALSINNSLFSFAFVAFNFLATATTPLIAASLAGGNKEQVSTGGAPKACLRASALLAQQKRVAARPA